jgi:hypothetical protein
VNTQPDYLEYTAPEEPGWDELEPYHPPAAHRVQDAPAESRPGFQIAQEPINPPPGKIGPRSNQDDDAPPPPDAFPPDWDHASDNLYDSVSLVMEMEVRVVESDSSAAEVESEPDSTDAQAGPDAPPAASPAELVSPTTAVAAPTNSPLVNTEDNSKLGAQDQSRFVGYLVPPSATIEDNDGTVRMLTIALRSTGDKTRDVLRLRRIHGMITTYPGNDRFAFHVFERGRGYLLEFPNFTFGLNPELFERLKGLLGAENLRLETITFQ